MRGRLNLLDALVFLAACTLMPMGYLTYGILINRWKPEIKDVNPVHVRQGADRMLYVNGVRFDRWSRVAIDRQPAAPVRFITPERLEVVLPVELARGPHTVQVTDFRQRTAVLHHAFEVVEPPPMPLAMAPVEPSPPSPPPPPPPLPRARDRVRLRVVLFEMDRRMIDILQTYVQNGAMTDEGMRVVGVLSWGGMPVEVIGNPLLTLFPGTSSRPTHQVKSRGTVWALVDLDMTAEKDLSYDPPQFSYRHWSVDTGTLMRVTLQDVLVPCIIVSRPSMIKGDEQFQEEPIRQAMR